MLSAGMTDRLAANAAIESFCIHARNLAEFLSNADTCGFDPRWFAPSYETQMPIPGALFGKINEQITHLSPRRTRVDAAKIGGDDRRAMFNALEVRLADWRSKLDPRYCELWKIPDLAAPQTPDAASTTTAPTSFLSMIGRLPD